MFSKKLLLVTIYVFTLVAEIKVTSSSRAISSHGQIKGQQVGECCPICPVVQYLTSTNVQHCPNWQGLCSPCMANKPATNNHVINNNCETLGGYKSFRNVGGYNSQPHTNEYTIDPRSLNKYSYFSSPTKYGTFLNNDPHSGYYNDPHNGHPYNNPHSPGRHSSGNSPIFGYPGYLVYGNIPSNPCSSAQKGLDSVAREDSQWEKFGDSEWDTQEDPQFDTSEDPGWDLEEDPEDPFEIPTDPRNFDASPTNMISRVANSIPAWRSGQSTAFESLSNLFTNTNPISNFAATSGNSIPQNVNPISGITDFAATSGNSIPRNVNPISGITDFAATSGNSIPRNVNPISGITDFADTSDNSILSNVDEISLFPTIPDDLVQLFPSNLNPITVDQVESILQSSINDYVTSKFCKHGLSSRKIPKETIFKSKGSWNGVPISDNLVKTLSHTRTCDAIRNSAEIFNLKEKASNMNLNPIVILAPKNVTRSLSNTFIDSYIPAEELEISYNEAFDPDKAVKVLFLPNFELNEEQIKEIVTRIALKVIKEEGDDYQELMFHDLSNSTVTIPFNDNLLSFKVITYPFMQNSGVTLTPKVEIAKELSMDLSPKHVIKGSDIPKNSNDIAIGCEAINSIGDETKPEEYIHNLRDGVCEQPLDDHETICPKTEIHPLDLIEKNSKINQSLIPAKNQTNSLKVDTSTLDLIKKNAKTSDCVIPTREKIPFTRENIQISSGIAKILAPQSPDCHSSSENKFNIEPGNILTGQSSGKDCSHSSIYNTDSSQNNNPINLTDDQDQTIDDEVKCETATKTIVSKCPSSSYKVDILKIKTSQPDGSCFSTSINNLVDIVPSTKNENNAQSNHSSPEVYSCLCELLHQQEVCQSKKTADEEDLKLKESFSYTVQTPQNIPADNFIPTTDCTKATVVVPQRETHSTLWEDKQSKDLLGNEKQQCERNISKTAEVDHSLKLPVNKNCLCELKNAIALQRNVSQKSNEYTQNCINIVPLLTTCQNINEHKIRPPTDEHSKATEIPIFNLTAQTLSTPQKIPVSKICPPTHEYRTNDRNPQPTVQEHSMAQKLPIQNVCPSSNEYIKTDDKNPQPTTQTHSVPQKIAAPEVCTPTYEHIMTNEEISKPTAQTYQTPQKTPYPNIHPLTDRYIERNKIVPKPIAQIEDWGKNTAHSTIETTSCEKNLDPDIEIDYRLKALVNDESRLCKLKAVLDKHRISSAETIQKENIIQKPHGAATHSLPQNDAVLTNYIPTDEQTKDNEIIPPSVTVTEVWDGSNNNYSVNSTSCRRDKSPTAEVDCKNCQEKRKELLAKILKEVFIDNLDLLCEEKK